MTVTVTIPGRPVAKERPRFGGGRTYTPARTRGYEEQVAWQCRAARVRLGDQPVDVTVELHSKKRLRGDLDNYGKAILDGLQKGEAIADDRQVVALHVALIADAVEDKAVVHLHVREAAA